MNIVSYTYYACIFRTKDLAEGANQFAYRAKNVRKKYWWKNMKIKLILGGVGAAFLLLILCVVAMKLGGSDSKLEPELEGTETGKEGNNTTISYLNITSKKANNSV